MEEEIKTNETNNNQINNSQNRNTKKTEGFALTSVILGSISFITWLLPLIGYPTTILAIIFGCVSKSKTKSTMSTLGIVFGFICLVLTLLNSILGVILALRFL